jgi:uncharacterized protein (TIGR03437 family)
MQKPLKRTLACLLWAGSCAWAQNSTLPSTVPATFQATYAELESSIASFQSTVSTSWNGKSSNVLWSAEVLAANANNGLPVLSGASSALAELRVLKGLGVKAVTVNMAFPIVDQDFYTFNGDPQDYASMVAFYANLATQIHAAGLKMIAEAALVYPGASGMNVVGYYASLSDDRFIAERGNNALTIAQQVGPDYINLNSEPDNDLINSGGKTNEYGNASGYTSMNQQNIATLRAAGVKIPLGAGIGSWFKANSGGAGAWVTALTSIPGISFFDIHVYPLIDNFLPELIAYTNQAQAAGLPVSMAQTWANKESSAEWAAQSPSQTDVYARNAYSFWTPIDQAYLTSLVDFANWKGLLYISPFWTQCFYAYLDYDQVSSLTPDQVTSMQYAAAATALAANQTSITALTYSNLIQGTPPANTVSAASFATGNLAPDSIVSIFGSNLSTGTASAQSLPLPITLSNTTASIEDSSGNQQPVPFIFVSPGQINAVIPPGLSAGAAVIDISSNGTVVAQSDVMLATVAPAIFTANQNGKGVPIAVVTTAQPNGSQSTVDVFQGNAVGSYTPAPINLGGPGDNSALVLYGTGIRGASSLSNVTVTIGTVTLPVQYAGPCDPAQFVAFDQVNVALPQSLAGAGQVTLTLTVDGVAAPPVTLDFQ